MNEPKRIHIDRFHISDVTGDGIRITQQTGPVSITNGVISNVHGTGISIGPPAQSDASLNLLELIRSLRPEELNEIRKLLGQSKNEQQQTAVVSSSSLGEALLTRGVRVVDVIDKIVRIFSTLSN